MEICGVRIGQVESEERDAGAGTHGWYESLGFLKGPRPTPSSQIRKRVLVRREGKKMGEKKTRGNSVGGRGGRSLPPEPS